MNDYEVLENIDPYSKEFAMRHMYITFKQLIYIIYGNTVNLSRRWRIGINEFFSSAVI